MNDVPEYEHSELSMESFTWNWNDMEKLSMWDLTTHKFRIYVSAVENLGFEWPHTAVRCRGCRKVMLTMAPQREIRKDKEEKEGKRIRRFLQRTDLQVLVEVQLTHGSTLLAAERSTRVPLI